MCVCMFIEENGTFYEEQGSCSLPNPVNVSFASMLLNPLGSTVTKAKHKHMLLVLEKENLEMVSFMDGFSLRRPACS